MRRLLTLVLSTAALAAVGIGAAWAAGDGTPLGQAGANVPCETGADFVAAQTGTSGDVSYTVPDGRWRIRSWTVAGPSAGKMALVVFRPTNTPGEYVVVGSTPAQALKKQKNKFGADINVRGGDLLGFWAEADTVCALLTSNTSDTVVATIQSDIPAAGSTTAMFEAGDGVRLNMQVRLEHRGFR